MKLKEAVKAALEEFFQKHRAEVIDAIKENLKTAPVAIVYFEEIDGFSVWCGDGEVKVTEREIVDEAYYLDIYYSGDLEVDKDKIDNLRESDDIASLFEHQIGGEEKENKFFAGLFKKEIQEVLKGFQYKKVGETFYVFKKQGKAAAR